jgi:hypothetical protein
MVLLLYGERPSVDYKDLTDEVKLELFNTMMSYAGSYTFDGEVVTHHVEASSNGVITGTALRRYVRDDGGGRIVLTADPEPTPRDGKLGVHTVIWELIR